MASTQSQWKNDVAHLRQRVYWIPTIIMTINVLLQDTQARWRPRAIMFGVTKIR